MQAGGLSAPKRSAVCPPKLCSAQWILESKWWPTCLCQDALWVHSVQFTHCCMKQVAPSLKMKIDVPPPWRMGQGPRPQPLLALAACSLAGALKACGRTPLQTPWGAILPKGTGARCAMPWENRKLESLVDIPFVKGSMHHFKFAGYPGSKLFPQDTSGSCLRVLVGIPLFREAGLLNPFCSWFFQGLRIRVAKPSILRKQNRLF